MGDLWVILSNNFIEIASGFAFVVWSGISLFSFFSDGDNDIGLGDG
jgi:hypothetical protein